MFKGITGISKIIKRNNLFYFTKSNKKFVASFIRLNRNVTLEIQNSTWRAINYHIFPTIINYIYQSQYKIKPIAFNKLHDESNDQIKLLIIKGKNVDIKLEADSKCYTKHHYLNGVYFLKEKELPSFLNEISY